MSHEGSIRVAALAGHYALKYKTLEKRKSLIQSKLAGKNIVSGPPIKARGRGSGRSGEGYKRNRSGVAVLLYP